MNQNWKQLLALADPSVLKDAENVDQEMTLRGMSLGKKVPPTLKRVLLQRTVELAVNIKIRNRSRAVRSTTLSELPATMQERGVPEFQVLFELVGHLKGAVPSEQRYDAGAATSYLPFALLFVEILFYLGKLTSEHTRITWADEDAISLQFENDWQSRRYAPGTELLSRAISFATGNPTKISTNRHQNVVATLAACLQLARPDVPILLPVSEVVAQELGISKVTLGQVINKLVREGLLIEVSKADNLRKRARTFLVQTEKDCFGDLRGKFRSGAISLEETPAVSGKGKRKAAR